MEDTTPPAMGVVTDAPSQESMVFNSSAPPTTPMTHGMVTGTSLVSPAGGIEATEDARTPIKSVPPSKMVTPDPKKVYTHDPLLPEAIVPNEELRFSSKDEAKEFFKYYACKAGFDVRTTKSRNTVLELCCNKQGHWDFYKPEEERVREKMSMRCECKAFVKAKWKVKKGYWFFERIRLEHTHPLLPSPSLTQYMKAHKDKDPVIMELIDQM